MTAATALAGTEVPTGRIFNGAAITVDNVPLLPLSEFQETIVRSVEGGQRLSGLWADLDGRMLWAVIADEATAGLRVLRTNVDGRLDSITLRCPQAHLFEREIAEQTGLHFEGHPWLRPVRYHRSWVPDRDAWGRAEDVPITPGEAFFRMDGQEVHEVAVGPVHAGVIEPGHFRFQCHGEHVYHLEIALGFQHRGIEKLLIDGPHKLTAHHIETAAGDTTIGHSWAYCRNVESLAGVSAPHRAEVIRAIALELERLANHVGDLGALAGDVGFLPTASYCGRIRGDFLNLTAEICGNRLGRGLIRPGGVNFDIEDARRDRMLRRLQSAADDVTGAIELLWTTPSVAARFERTGVVRQEDARAVGLVGVAGRACGLPGDTRHDFPWGPYSSHSISPVVLESGDVQARAMIRWREIQQSLALTRRWLTDLPEGPVRVPVGALAPNQLAASLVEGWRGEIVHLARTGANGRFARYKLIDPSFRNWSGLALALRDEQISDFPLCNKSFNLSYCGHDL